MFEEYSNEQLLELYREWAEINHYDPLATPIDIIEARDKFGNIDVVQAEILRRMY